MNFSFISANLGDDAAHAINSWPQVPANPDDERQFQCHANIDLQRWLTLSQQTAGGIAAASAALYKVRSVTVSRSARKHCIVIYALADSVQLCHGAILRRSFPGPGRSHVSAAELAREQRSFTACCRYDERLRRWGGDKQTHAYELASKSFEFFVVPLTGIVHQPHERVKSWAKDDGIKCADNHVCSERKQF